MPRRSRATYSSVWARGLSDCTVHTTTKKTRQECLSAFAIEKKGHSLTHSLTDPVGHAPSQPLFAEQNGPAGKSVWCWSDLARACGCVWACVCVCVQRNTVRFYAAHVARERGREEKSNHRPELWSWRTGSSSTTKKHFFNIEKEKCRGRDGDILFSYVTFCFWCLYPSTTYIVCRGQSVIKKEKKKVRCGGEVFHTCTYT